MAHCAPGAAESPRSRSRAFGVMRHGLRSGPNLRSGSDRGRVPEQEHGRQAQRGDPREGDEQRTPLVERRGQCAVQKDADAAVAGR